MFLSIFLVFFACVYAQDLIKPKFQVLTPDELMVEVPHYEDKELVTLRIGVRRAGQDADDLELGENNIDNNRAFIYDQRLKLKEGDVVNYLVVFRDRKGYQAQSGNYYFNGVYYRKPFGRRQRFRRDAETSAESTTEVTEQSATEKYQDNTDETEEFDPTASRFGGRGPHHRRNWNHHHGGYPQNPGFNPQNPGFNPFGPGPQHPHPSYPNPMFPPHHGHGHGEGPSFGTGPNCNDHSHDMCHGRDTERWREVPGFGHHTAEYHCKICNSLAQGRNGPTTSTTTPDPDIDIRFGPD